MHSTFIRPRAPFTSRRGPEAAPGAAAYRIFWREAWGQDWQQDVRVGNVIFADDFTPAAVLDWELSTLGHPLSDFAYQVMAWRLSPQEFRGIKGADLAALGIPPRRTMSRRIAGAPDARQSRTSSST